MALPQISQVATSMTSRTDTALVHQYYPFQVSQQSPAYAEPPTKTAPQPIPTRAALQSSQQLMTLVQAPLLRSVQETAVRTAVSCTDLRSGACTRVYTTGSESPSPSDDSIFCVVVTTWTGTFTAK